MQNDPHQLIQGNMHKTISSVLETENKTADKFPVVQYSYGVSWVMMIKTLMKLFYRFDRSYSYHFHSIIICYTAHCALFNLVPTQAQA